MVHISYLALVSRTQKKSLEIYDIDYFQKASHRKEHTNKNGKYKTKTMINKFPYAFPLFFPVAIGSA